MVRLTRWIIGITAFTAALAIGATIFTGLQWWSSREAIEFARQSAQQSGADTRSAIRLSERVAAASERQSRATEIALGISDRLAVAAETQSETSKSLSDTARQQVDTASRDLKLKQRANIDILISNGAVTRDSNFVAIARITNRGTYTINNLTISGASSILSRSDSYKIWKVLLPSKSISLVPGVDHTLNLGYLPLQQQEWEKFVRGELFMIHGVEVRFVDAAGQKQLIRRCIGYSGAGTETDKCH